MSKTTPSSSDANYAWAEVARVGLHRRSATERVADFLEIHGPYTEAEAREQAARCVQCPEPACVQGCPLANRIPEWLALTAEGHFLEAATVLQSQSCLPEVCARVCPADRMCEGMCILGGKAEPVSVRALEQFLTEYAFAQGGVQTAVPPPNGLRVAVVGSGPGGLTCAEILSQRGYAVTVFDWRLVPGGLLVSGTPAFRVERSVVERRIELLKQRGVTFRLGVTLGVDLSLAEVRSGFDAMFLGFGARKARGFDGPGHDASGVVQALSFLVQQQAEPHPEQSPITVAGKRVMVLGGGDMAMDCLRMALRCGAREAVCAYRRDAANLACDREQYECAVEEGARFLFQATPLAMLSDERGAVRAVRLGRTEPAAEEPDGRRRFALRPGDVFETEADWVMLALGFEPASLPPEHPFGSLDRDGGGGIRVDEHQMTSMPGVFAGGELVRGPSKVLDVVRDARRAAQGIHRHLQPHA